MASKPPPSELAAWLARQRWFAAKSRRIAHTLIDDRIPVGDATLCVVRVVLDDGETQAYAVALRGGLAMIDAFDDPGFCRALLDVMAAAGRLAGERGALVGRPSPAFPRGLPAGVTVQRLTGEQSNTSIVFGDTLIVKHFRRLVAGVNPELEIGRFLTERVRFPYVPRLAGWLEYLDAQGDAATFAVGQVLVPGARDGWRWMLERLACGDAAVEALRRLGERTAALHTALAGDTSDPDFAAEPITAADVAAWADAVARQMAHARAALGGRPLPEPVAAADALVGLVGCAKIRHHGDFHLGQTLHVDATGDFMIIDFEGEPLRPLAERRRKHTPLRDVAGMLRSLGYAAATAGTPAWEAPAREAFLAGYRAAAGAAPFLPDSHEAFARALAVFEVEKAAYEVVYEANHRPDWLEIPARALVRASASLAASRAAGAA